MQQIRLRLMRMYQASTVVVSAEAAMALTPIALIPQVVLGGLMVPMTTNPNLEPLMLIMPARWGFQGLVAQERLAVKTDPAWVVDLNRPTLNRMAVMNAPIQTSFQAIGTFGSHLYNIAKSTVIAPTERTGFQR